MPRSHDDELRVLAHTILQPGFDGAIAPAWLLRRIGEEGLASVVLLARNITGPAQLAELTRSLRAENPELIIAVSEEAGDVTRVESRTGSSRPGNLALGMVDDVELTETVARDVGVELHAAGISLNYAPVADVNSSPLNPVIGVRSFGAGPDLVARHTAAWIRGMQSAGVAACPKHFPGHGDTLIDSHLGLPRYDATAETIAEQALPPFRAALRCGVRAVMIGHLLVPAYDPRLPATLSPYVLNDLLRKQLGFDGLVVTDGIEMQAVSQQFGIGGACVRAVANGADAVSVGIENKGEDVVEHLATALVDAVHRHDLPEERLCQAASRVGEFAQWSARLSSTVPLRRIRSDVGLSAARRALRVTTRDPAGLPLVTAPHVAEFAQQAHPAVGKETPWGVAAPLRERLAAVTSVRVYEDDVAGGPSALDDLVLAPAAGRPLVVAVRDAARHSWVRRVLTYLLDARPDTVVVEMGLPGPERPGAVHIATHGATRASGVATAELLTGR